MPEYCLGGFYTKVFSNISGCRVTELMRMPTMVSSPVFEFQFLSFLEYVFWRWKGQVTGARNRMTIGIYVISLAWFPARLVFSVCAGPVAAR